MEKNFQAQLLELANGICLFDAYLTLAGYTTFEDKLWYLQKAMSKHIVGEDGRVNDANRLYTEVLGQNKKVSKAYEYHGDEPVIACWDNAHFMIVDKDDKVIYDPLGPRENKYNKVTSYRVVEGR